MRSKYGYELGLMVYDLTNFDPINRWVIINEVWNGYRKKYNYWETS